jgi:hypothetical protein
VLCFSATRNFMRYGALSDDAHVQIIHPKFQTAHHELGRTLQTLSPNLTG